jgi:predicted alpha/beta superfamily hydrolase
MTPFAREAVRRGERRKEVLPEVWSPQLRNSRTIDIYLPASYESGRRFPVMYMQDGQNLSDPDTAFAGTWQLDEVLRTLARAGIEPIVVGVHNTERRLAEYSPFPDAKHGGGDGDRYLSFLADTLKPRIDRLFRTSRSAAGTLIVGSSMGGLISFYAWFRRPDVFGVAGALSPSFWYGRQGLLDYVARTPLPPGPLYLDVGTAEGAAAVRDVRATRLLLRRKGLDRRRFRYREERRARHEESAWSRRLAPAIAFLLRRPRSSQQL